MATVILVTGATGKQGGAVVNALLKQNFEDFTILALTRNVSGSKAQNLAAKSESIKLVQGDLNDVPSLFKEAQKVAGQPIWGVFSVQVSMGKGVTSESETRQGKELIDGSIKAGIQYFVYSSVERGGDEASWDSQTPIPHFQSKYHIEQHLRDMTGPGKAGESLGWTILRPVTFMDNLTPSFQTKVFMAAMRNWLGNKPVQWIATSDIGVFAAKAFTNPKSWNRKAVGLAGDELSFDELDHSFLNTTGSPVPVTYWFFGSALTFMIAEVQLMIGWFASHGYHADIRTRRAEHPRLLTMEQWLLKESPFETKDQSH
ncbi:NAD(P)-binding protein [Xylariaceae sp. FL1651]|nr:NAD(P)-binding protein [Xylariaceae sp. FL1651]